LLAVSALALLSLAGVAVGLVYNRQLESVNARLADAVTESEGQRGRAVAEGEAKTTQAREGVRAEQVEVAARQANVHTIIQHLPHGYETRVGEAGAKLSGGQKQRLSIALALYATPITQPLRAGLSSSLRPELRNRPSTPPRPATRRSRSNLNAKNSTASKTECTFDSA